MKIFFIFAIILFITLYLHVFASGDEKVNPGNLQTAGPEIEITPNPFDAKEYSFVTKWGSKGDSPGQFDFIFFSKIAVDKFCNIYVTDSHNNRIQKFDSNGKFLNQWFHDMDDSLEVMGAVMADPENNLRLQSPEGITIDQDNNIYITEGAHRIQKFDSNGNFIVKWGNYYAKDNNCFKTSTIKADLKSNIYFIEDKGIQKIDSNGRFLNSWKIDATCLIVDSNFNIYAYNYDYRLKSNAYSMKKFDSSGNFVADWNCDFFCEDMAIDMADNIYIADDTNNCIKKFDSSGNLITKWGSKGTEDGQFSFFSSAGIAVDQYGNVYVLDGENSRIQKFTPKL